MAQTSETVNAEPYNKRASRAQGPCGSVEEEETRMTVFRPQGLLTLLTFIFK